MSRHPVLSALLVGSLAAATPMLLPPTAEALEVKVEVDGKAYAITTFEGSYEDQPDLFAPTPPQGQGRMAWWGDPFLAEQLAFEVGDSLSNTINPDQGVYFAFEVDNNNDVNSQVLALNPPRSSSVYPTGKSERMIYAVLSPNQPTASVPGPLPIFGATAAFAWSRRLRKRIGKGQS